MKFLFLSLILLISTYTFAQKDELYHIYKFEKKAGVTDTLSNDKLPANYWWYEELYGKMKWIFKDENQVAIFDRNTGTNELVQE
ncbi:MAG: hypothetical protein EOO19_06855 [Chryseobacterium sp.]|nr:MAG: hypothetical protein EOO19_06855 [Chryseobacterium sp.]